MSTEIQQIVQAKEAARRRLRALPWLEKLELLEKLRGRQLHLRQTRVRESSVVATKDARFAP